MNQIRSFFARYIFPLIIILLGITLLVLSVDQNNYFLVGGISILGIGIISWLFVAGIIGRVLQIVLLLVLLGLSGYLIYANYKVVDDQIEYLAKKQRIADHVIQRLKDIRTAQIAFEKANDKYTGNFDTLVDFLKNGEIPIVKSIGTLPDSAPTLELAKEAGIVKFKIPEGMTEKQAAEKGLIIRDTIYVSVLKNTFKTEEEMKKRKYPFYVDSLPYVPHSGVKFKMKAGKVNAGGVTKPVFEVLDPEPFAKQYKVGSLEKVSTTGNWSNQ